VDVHVILFAFASWYALVLPMLRESLGLSLSDIWYASSWLRYEFFPPYDRHLAISMIEDRRRVKIDSLLGFAEFSAATSKDVAAASLFWNVMPSEVVATGQPIPLVDEIMMRRLAHAYSVIEAQELELAIAHIRSAGVVDDARVIGLAEAVFQFKPYLGIRHRHEIRYIIRWWLDADGGAKPSRRDLREVKYAIRTFRPVGLYYSDQTQSEEPEGASAVPAEENQDLSAHDGAEGDLLDIGSDRETPAAAAGLVEGLDLLFRRLGPPPEGSSLQPSVASSGGGDYGGR
jgi:hypothetical protein